MQKINIKIMIVFTTFSIIFFVFVIPVLLSLSLDMIPAYDQPGYGGSGRVSIYGDRYLKQYFISEDKNLTAVATSIKNPNLKNKKDVYFKLYDENNNLLREVNLSGKNIGDGDFVKIIFEPVKDSKSKEYYFTISSPFAGDEEILELYVIDKTNQILNFEYDEEKRPGGIPMVTFHKPESRLETVYKVFGGLFNKN